MWSAPLLFLFNLSWSNKAEKYFLQGRLRAWNFKRASVKGRVWMVIHKTKWKSVVFHRELLLKKILQKPAPSSQLTFNIYTVKKQYTEKNVYFIHYTTVTITVGDFNHNTWWEARNHTIVRFMKKTCLLFEMKYV